MAVESPFKFRRVPRQLSVEEEAERALGGHLTENSLTSEQHAVFMQICSWYEKGEEDAWTSPHSLIKTLGGYAGVGKSTLLSVLAGKYDSKRVAFAAYTGKATSVLRRKLIEANNTAHLSSVSTLHSLLYMPIINHETGEVTGWTKQLALPFDLIVVDEASMVDEKMLEDLKSFDIPILAVGDHGQLPPVQGSFNLMENPELRLETIHRVADDSPILHLSAMVRRFGQVPRHTHDGRAVQILPLHRLGSLVAQLAEHPNISFENIGFICYTNRERVDINRMVRQCRWGDMEAPLYVGDTVICLKNVDNTIFNGMRGVVHRLDDELETETHYYADVFFEEDEVMATGPILKKQFDRDTTIKNYEDAAQGSFRPRNWNQVGFLFDYGYALTVHKSQGSQFEHVIVLNNFPRGLDDSTRRRALYTAVTRCSAYLVVLQ